MSQTCLMLGAGHSPPERRLVAATSVPDAETLWVKLDVCAETKPDVVFNLDLLDAGRDILPFDDDSFDEIHAYEVLEHFGIQGYYEGFFRTFREFWRVLKPDGLFIGTTPSLVSKWLWADPGHTRVITAGTLVFLTEAHYDQLGQTASTDYRSHVSPCWWTLDHREETDDHFVFALKKVQ